MASPRKKVPTEIKTLMHPSRNPEGNIEAAKARAIHCLNQRQKNPRLTALEQAFYKRYRAEQITGITNTGSGRYVVSGRASEAS
tara:strand:- start:11225 stop:11476 length:252 start_codon:yes stop_codon:yes gene_type:complete